MKITVFGASGRTGIPLVEQALAAGHDVTAFVRDPAKLPVKHPKLTVVQGDARDAAKVEQAVAGADAVLSVLGQTRPPTKDLLTNAMQNVTAAMQKCGTRRLIFLTGAGVPDPSDKPSAGRTFMMSLLKLLAKDVLDDSIRHVEKVRNSGLEWVAVRAPRLKDGPRTGQYRTGALSLGPNHTISRADVADFMLKQAANPTYAGQMPMIANA